MTIKLEVGKTYLRRDGTKYRVDFIPKFDYQGHESNYVIGTWWSCNNGEFRVDMPLSGLVYDNPKCEHAMDIVSEYTPPMEIWVNIYPKGGLYLHRSELSAKNGLRVRKEVGITKKFREVIE